MDMYIDIHAHLDFFDEKKIASAVENAKKAGVGLIVNAGISPERTKKTLEIMKKYPNIVKGSFGIYPVEMLDLSPEDVDEQFKLIRKLHAEGKVIAIGEVGMDMKEGRELEKQKRNFERFVALALELDLPIVVHSRKAEAECIEILEKLKAKKVVMHCFSGKSLLIERVSRNKWFFSIPANIKFSEHFQKLVKKVDISQLLCETDTPFLHPDKLKDNEPANVVESYKKIAEIKGISLGECEKMIEENYKRVFEL
ncbi:MAG: TatD family hydrolase [archaeon]|jgi:TatD DNase family protein|nr:TatD family hydrolase [archaeon]